jgi:hypothetical protein
MGCGSEVGKLRRGIWRLGFASLRQGRLGEGDLAIPAPHRIVFGDGVAHLALAILEIIRARKIKSMA